ncbi:uncharacterized protein LOC128218912 [Mya arenaria]|uniref:uncharacterized protein LOC128218912 n=1 Tax=Mya arenaria TaxID=6604 RepID=UPI0022E6F72D|nr:uncharacterized protein LOC128218912 [Mya arenaria]
MADHTYRSRRRIMVRIFSNQEQMSPNFRDPNGKPLFKKLTSPPDDNDIDVEKIKWTFKFLGLDERDIVLSKRRKKEEVIKMFNRWGGNCNEEHEEKNLAQWYDYFFFVFLGYCNDIEKTHFQFDDGRMPISDIYDQIKTMKPYVGKPKVFLIQADDISLLPSKFITKGGSDREIKTRTLPQDADRLIISSDIPQLFANRNHPEYTKLTDSTGSPGQAQPPRPRWSFLVEAFSDVMTDRQYTTPGNGDLLTRTCFINAKVSALVDELHQDLRAERTREEETRENPHVPMTVSTLRKLIFL